jgi:hypothetical protein
MRRGASTTLLAGVVSGGSIPAPPWGHFGKLVGSDRKGAHGRHPNRLGLRAEESAETLASEHERRG